MINYLYLDEYFSSFSFSSFRSLSVHTDIRETRITWLFIYIKQDENNHQGMLFTELFSVFLQSCIFSLLLCPSIYRNYNIHSFSVQTQIFHNIRTHTLSSHFPIILIVSHVLHSLNWTWIVFAFKQNHPFSLMNYCTVCLFTKRQVRLNTTANNTHWPKLYDWRIKRSISP